MARQHWPNESAVGKRFNTNPDAPSLPWSEIVGVVADVKQTRLDAAAQPTVYYPQNLFPQPAISLLVRTEGDPARLIGPTIEAVRAMEPNAVISGVRSMRGRVGTRRGR